MERILDHPAAGLQRETDGRGRPLRGTASLGLHAAALSPAVAPALRVAAGGAAPVSQASGAGAAAPVSSRASLPRTVPVGVRVATPLDPAVGGSPTGRGAGPVDRSSDLRERDRPHGGVAVGLSRG